MLAPALLSRTLTAWPPRRAGGPLDGNDLGPAMVPVLEHVGAVRGGYGSGSGFGGGVGSGAAGFTMGGGGGVGTGSGPGGASVSTACDGLAGMGGAGDTGSGPGGGMGSGGGVGDTPGRFRGEGAGNSATENLMSFEPAFGYGAGSGGGGGGGGLSPTHTGGALGAGGGFQGTAIETQQYELQMRMVDILMESLQYARALRYGVVRAPALPEATRKLWVRVRDGRSLLAPSLFRGCLSRALVRSTVAFWCLITGNIASRFYSLWDCMGPLPHDAGC